MNNAGMTGALVLIGAGLFTNAFMANTPTVQAVPASGAVAGALQGDPVIVDFGSLHTAQVNSLGWPGFYRLWSDGRIEVRLLDIRSNLSDIVCYGFPLVDSNNCGIDDAKDTGWIELPAPPGGEGYACRSDVNGDRRVDGIDLATLLSQWGDGVSCDPQPTYPCFDLGNLNLPAGVLN